MPQAHWAAVATDARLLRVHPLFIRAAVTWVPLAVAVTGVAALVYGALQQDLRQGANDPQIQMAEDGAAKLNAGATPSAVVPSETIELATSLQPYVMVFNEA